MALSDIMRLKVGGFWYTVTEERDDALDSACLVGEHDRGNLTLSIKSTLDEQAKALCLMHEVTHAISSIYCSGHELEESAVEGVAQGLFQVMRDNPALANYLSSPYESNTCGYCDCDIDRKCSCSE
jgi:hypothetical protein